MAITYTWAVTGLKVRNAPNVNDVVVQTYWTKTGTDDAGDSGTFNGATPFSMADIDPSQFVPFDQLTEADVLGWIQPLVTGSYEEHVNAEIQKQINLQKDPETEPPLPWAPPTDTTTEVTP